MHKQTAVSSDQELCQKSDLAKTQPLFKGEWLIFHVLLSKSQIDMLNKDCILILNTTLLSCMSVHLMVKLQCKHINEFIVCCLVYINVSQNVYCNTQINTLNYLHLASAFTQSDLQLGR